MKNYNTAAFPINVPERGHNQGLSKLELFAAMAMNAMSSTFPEFGRSHADMIAKQSVEIAKALLNELEKD